MEKQDQDQDPLFKTRTLQDLLFVNKNLQDLLFVNKKDHYLKKKKKGWTEKLQFPQKYFKKQWLLRFFFFFFLFEWKDFKTF